jgi:hypothetical protein
VGGRAERVYLGMLLRPEEEEVMEQVEDAA